MCELVSFPLLLRTLSDQGPTFMTSPNLNHFLKSLKSSQYSHSGVMNLGGTQAFSP